MGSGTNLATTADILLFFAIARQAERSIDAVLHGEWSDLQEFYRGERLSTAQDAERRLVSVASSNGRSFAPASKATATALSLFGEESKPSVEKLFSARSNLFKSLLFFERLGADSVSFEKARKVEHFNCSEYYTHYSVCDVLNGSG